MTDSSPHACARNRDVPPVPAGGGAFRAYSRLAPTPSGYLHQGNAVNFILTWMLVRHSGGRLNLRIDDADAGRCRPEYVEDIFRQLEWLGLDWDHGPAGPDDFFARHSQLLRLDRYRLALEKLELRGIIFYCTCTRRQIKNKAGANHLYPGTCRSCQRPPAAAHTTRIMVARQWTFAAASREFELLPGKTPPAAEDIAEPLISVQPAAEMGDFILWRRDELPAYQLASLVDDLDEQINLLVRGRDLLPSSAAQYFLAEQLGPAGQTFLKAKFLHHPLLTDTTGRKLAKSDRALSLAAMRRAGATPGDLYRLTARFLGLAADDIDSPADLLAAAADLPTPGQGRGLPVFTAG